MTERNFNQLSNDEGISQLDLNSPEGAELKFHFNTIFNDCSKKTNNENKIYEIEGAYSLKNQYIALNFEKREMNEVSAYGWFYSDENEEKKIEEFANKIRTKGLKDFDKEIYVSPIPNLDESNNFIILCKFIVGQSEVLFQDEEISIEQKKEYLNNNYDTIVRLQKNQNNKDNVKKYNILREENIELLYHIKYKVVEIQNQIVECTSPTCTSNEATDKNERDKKEERSIYYCLLKDNYYCNVCHTEIHSKEVYFGKFDTNRCELKKYLNLAGECPNKELHPNRKIFDVDYFCIDCLKGICSFCKVYGNQKHPDLHLITDLFNKCKVKNKEMNPEFKALNNKYLDMIKQLNGLINHIQNENKSLGNKLRLFTKTGFEKLFENINNLYTEEGEKLVSICYQLNFLKDNLIFYHNAYVNKEKLCENNNLKQELFWTKRTHFAHLLYLIDLKEKIKTKYKVDEVAIENMINSNVKEIGDQINVDLGDVDEHADDKKEDDNGLLTVEALLENARVLNKDFKNK